MSKPIQTCVLGVGLGGMTFHVPFVLALPQLFTLHSVLERNPKTEGGKVRQRFGVSPKIYASLESVLADSEIELVIISTPNETHYPFAKACLTAGKHVLVDKPVTDSVAHAKELGELAASKGLVIYAYQNRRWDSDFLALKRLINLPESHAESIGPILELESHFDRYRKGLKGTWKDQPLPAAGLLYDLGAHLIDQSLALFGRPQSITAFVQNVRGVGDPNVDDSFTIHLKYERDSTRQYPLTVILRSHPLSVRSPQIRYIARGSRGTFVKYGIDTQEEHLKLISSPNAILKDDFGREPEYLNGQVEKMLADDETIVKTSWPTPDAGSYIELFQNLGASIRTGAEPAVKWEEATQVIELIELAHESSRRGQTLSVSPLA
ncbi:oxidoreductase [Coprinopsis sp. MPI-PUGE-AT-0042]|nr:oxidoreductase [Coprinopsis sp. MPI-PUGE-AT-0042]